MNQQTKDTLAIIARCVTEGGAKLETALESAYQLGKFDGGMEIALTGIKGAEKKLKEAA